MQVIVGEKLTGKVEKITKYGAFVSLDGNKKGLVHISEVSNKYIKNVEDILAIGQEVSVVVLAIKPDGRIDLSIKKAEEGNRSTELGRSVKQTNYNRKPSERFEKRSGSSMRNKKVEQVKPVNFEDKLADFLKNSEEKYNIINKRLNKTKKTRR